MKPYKPPSACCVQCNEDGSPGSHVACTVEMSNLAQKYEVAVIDEIQVEINWLMAFKFYFFYYVNMYFR